MNISEVEARTDIQRAMMTFMLTFDLFLLTLRAWQLVNTKVILTRFEDHLTLSSSVTAHFSPDP